MELLFDTEPIVGWRIWKIGRGDKGLVLSDAIDIVADAIDKGDSQALRDLRRFHLLPLAWNKNPWPGGRRHEAKCEKESGTTRYFFYLAQLSPVETHAAPHALCHCGSWAVKESELAGSIQNYAQLRNEPFAVGEVCLWGHVVEETKGYRAQYAYPKSLRVVNGTEEMISDLKAVYGVPVQGGAWQKEWTPEAAPIEDILWNTPGFPKMTAMVAWGDEDYEEDDDEKLEEKPEEPQPSRWKRWKK